jgi:hypothetical protein
MKKLFTVLAILISFSAHSQNWPIDKETNKILFTDVIKVDSVTQNELFVKANEWFAKTYNDSKEVIQLRDKESGKIVGKGAFRVYAHLMGIHDYGLVRYTIKLMIKEGRYKYEICDLYHEFANSGVGSGGDMMNEKAACGTMSIPNKQWNEIKTSAFNQTNQLIESLNSFMTSKNISKKDNW